MAVEEEEEKEKEETKKKMIGLEETGVEEVEGSGTGS